jgi:shikimate dehydrogenase
MIKLGLIGYPLGHSLSPQIHCAALEACGLDGDYYPYPIRPNDKQVLNDLLSCVRSGEITGLNVTIPHKQNVIHFLDELTPTAQGIGAVNTIYMRESKLVGDNTDAQGFLHDLYRFLDGKKSSVGDRPSALVLGAGGAAHAVVYALVEDGWSVTIAARRLEQARQLASQFVGSQAIDLNRITLQSSNLQLMVNTTPLGMTPDIDQSPLPDNVMVPESTFIYDLIYNPRQTKLVKDARSRGFSATTGLGMLIEQAALAFELWTGCSPSREIMQSVVEDF